MKKLTDQLQSVSKFLVNLSKQVEKISDQIDKHQSSKAKPVQTKKASAVKAPKTKKDTPAKPVPVLDTVFDVIKRSKKGVTIAKIKEKTGLGTRQISNALYKLSKRGNIEAISRGLYVKK